MFDIVFFALKNECHPDTCTQMTATEQWIFLCAAHKTPKEVSVFNSPNLRKLIYFQTSMFHIESMH